MKELQGTARATVNAPIERAFELLESLEGYPTWHPEVVKDADVLERDGNGRPVKARADLHVAYGPIVRDFHLLLTVVAQPGRGVKLTRIPHDRNDPEEFEVSWSLRGEAETEISLIVRANLSIPRLLPVGGIGDGIAQGFVSAAVRALSS